jgi:hypothetical protein
MTYRYKQADTQMYSATPRFSVINIIIKKKIIIDIRLPQILADNFPNGKKQICKKTITMLLDIKITIKRANVPIKLLSTLING